MKYVKSKSIKKIEDVSNISQYYIHNNYITLIGEFHSIAPGLYNKKNSITVSNFILDRIRNNSSIRIFLEYSEYQDPETVGSVNINQTYKILKSHKLLDKIIPFECRYHFIDIKKYPILFNIHNFRKLTNNQIRKYYIEPYFNKRSDLLYLNKNVYNEEAYDYLITYLDLIKGNFEYYSAQMEYPIEKRLFKTPEEISKQLVSEWAKVADFFILKELLKDKKMEYIILVGDKHRENLQTIFNMFPKIFQSSGSLTGIYEIESKYDENLNINTTTNIEKPKKILRNIRNRSSRRSNITSIRIQHPVRSRSIRRNSIRRERSNRVVRKLRSHDNIVDNLENLKYLKYLTYLKYLK